MSSEEKVYFAVWHGKTGWVLDAYPEEVNKCRGEMIASGNHFAGPFKSASDALIIAARNLEGS